MNGDQNRPDPSPPHKVVSKDIGGKKFTAGFYPGFASRITVNGVSVYNQKEDGPLPFVLPPGAYKTWSTSALELSSDKGYRVTLHLDDPDHVIDHIELVLRNPNAGVTAMSADGGADADNVCIDNWPVVCPPMC